jgi:uncharacterized protein (TIGR02453 family)
MFDFRAKLQHFDRKITNFARKEIKKTQDMRAKEILAFFKQLSENNNRDWFHAHRAEYDELRADFEEGIGKALAMIASFDQSVAHLQVKETTYRVNRDIRFSNGKSPYKTHIGAYIAAHGKKALHGGYYIHLENDSCMLACGNYYLPTNILNACRWEMVNNVDTFRECVDTPQFKKIFKDNLGIQSKLKTLPHGFPKDFAYPEFLKMKDYCMWHYVDNDFFEGDAWLKKAEKVFKTAKPFMDFINNVIDDYE